MQRTNGSEDRIFTRPYTVFWGIPETSERQFVSVSQKTGGESLADRITDSKVLRDFQIQSKVNVRIK